MKKILLAFALATASLVTFNSCTKEYITNNNMLPGVTYIATITPNTWTPISTGSNIYSIDIPFPELDQQYFDLGTIQVALQFSNAANTAYLNNYNAIPATINQIHYSYEYFVGKITVFAEVRTDETSIDLDRNIKAKVTLTDAQNGG